MFGVFWWLTHRGDDVESTPNAEVVAEETTTEEGTDTESETTEGSEATTEESETDTGTEVEATTTETTASTTPVVTTTTTAATTTQTVAPVAPVVTAPVRVTPAVPNRSTDVKVYMYEWNVDLSSKTIPAGTVNFTVQNDGRFTHDFNVTGFGNLGKVMPSETRNFTVKLRAGEYEAFSERRQDYERGVAESFTVVQ